MREGGGPFADATWDMAWQTSAVDEPAWAEIRDGLRREAAAARGPREGTFA